MAQLVADCPRCDAKKITFNLKAMTHAGTFQNYGKSHNRYEAFCVCLHCYASTVFVISDRLQHASKITQDQYLGINGTINEYIDIRGYISLKDANKTDTPEHVPDDISAIFQEGAACLSIECNNAAGTMFRLCIDIVSKNLLPEEITQGLNHRTRRDLGLRLPWLFDNGKLPENLRELSMCIKEDGNDGAHAGTLSAEDAEDMLDFTVMLLERIYTEPERVRIAQERRVKRRDNNQIKTDLA